MSLGRSFSTHQGRDLEAFEGCTLLPHRVPHGGPGRTLCLLKWGAALVIIRMYRELWPRARPGAQGDHRAALPRVEPLLCARGLGTLPGSSDRTRQWLQPASRRAPRVLTEVGTAAHPGA